MHRCLMLIALAIPMLAGHPAADKGFVPLFDGRTLNGWEVLNGFARYHVEDGAIVGTSVNGGPNTFLCTKREYGDFVLELKTRMDPAQNSGVQIRSHRYAKDVIVLHL